MYKVTLTYNHNAQETKISCSESRHQETRCFEQSQAYVQDQETQCIPCSYQVKNSFSISISLAIPISIPKISVFVFNKIQVLLLFVFVTSTTTRLQCHSLNLSRTVWSGAWFSLRHEWVGLTRGFTVHC